MSQPFQAFTIGPFPGLLREIVIDLGISVSFPILPGEQIRSNDKRILHTKALWDTGATNSVITKSTAKQLGLKPSGMVESVHAQGKTIVPTYLVHIFLPNRNMIASVRVSECADTEGRFGVIIGMDIITMGDFAITNVKGKTTVSFRIPSIETIDYSANVNNQAPVLNISSSTPRNSLCPCKSGKKYKHCHGKVA